jgi:hypothetical protein
MLLRHRRRLATGAIGPVGFVVGLAAVLTTPGSAGAQAASCAVDATPIGVVQGEGETSPLVGQPVTVRGVVVGDYEYPGTGATSDHLRGFYVQDGGDGNAATSDGLFVFQGNDDDVALGDEVQVTGVVAEFQGQTQLAGGATVEVCDPAGDGTPTIAPTPVDLPVPSPTWWERVEGMLVTVPEELTVTEHFQLGRFGQVVVSSDGRLPQPTDVVAPGSAANTLQAANALRRLIVDDDLQRQNPDPVRFARGGEPLSAANTLRGGDTVSGLTGVLTYTWAGNAASGNAYRLRPLGALGGSADFEAANPRPAMAPDVDGQLRVGAANLLNWFVTLDVANRTPPDPLDNRCGPGNDVECRGADSAAELARQRDKLVELVVGTGADVLGLVELENSTGVDPLSDPERGLVPALNTRTAPGTYAAVDTGVIGSDAIRVGLLYRPQQVRPVGPFEVIDSADDARFDDDLNRPVLVQTFEEQATGERFTAAVLHLKSKGSDCLAVGDPDLGDGQGNCNRTRQLAAAAVVDVLASMVASGDADPDVLVLGDLNAYAQEDPVREFTDAGYANLVEQLQGEDAYSYVFDGQWGSLDHALASPGLRRQVSGADVWHVNADEPPVLDYNVEFKSAGQVETFYAPDVFRSSDHDPVLVGLTLDSAPSLRVDGRAGRCVDDDAATVQVLLTDPDTPSEALVVTAEADGAAVDPASVVVSGAGPVRTVGFTALPGSSPRSGRITVTVSDGQLSRSVDVAIRVGTARPDLLCAGRGPDVLRGGGGDDSLGGGRGPDVLDGGAGADTYDGGPGRDALLGVDPAEGDVVIG